MKTLFAILLVPILSYANGAFEGYSCTQKCGFTPQTPDTVYARALDTYTVNSMLRDACNWKKMNLQGEPACSLYKYDPAKSESGIRCQKGINTNGNCMATVDGRGDINKGSYSSFTKYSNSFDDAIELAKQACRDSYSGRTSDYRCDLVNYYAY